MMSMSSSHQNTAVGGKTRTGGAEENSGKHFHKKLENLKSALSSIKTNLNAFKHK